MTKQSTPAPRRPAHQHQTPQRPAQRPASKTPVTAEAVRRVQSSTAAGNGGQQAPWTQRLQSTVDKRAAAATPHGKPAGAGGAAAGQRGAGKASSGKKSA